MPDIQILFQSLLSGAAAGGVYALFAIGFGVILRTTRVFNFAQGGFGTVGAYVSFTVFVLWHQPFWLALLVGCLATGALAVAIEVLVLRPLYKLGDLYTFISTIGVGFAIESGTQLIWTAYPRIMPSIFGNRAIQVFGLRVVPEVIWIFVISLALAAATFLFLTRTKLGTAMRACAQDRQVSGLLGIDPNFMFMMAFFISGILAGLAGILIAPITFIRPTMGSSLGIPGFIAAMVGGLGSMQGAVIGGLILGILQSMAVFVISPSYRDVVLYAVLALILLVRPSGLFGEEAVQARLA